MMSEAQDFHGYAFSEDGEQFHGNIDEFQTEAEAVEAGFDYFDDAEHISVGKIRPMPVKLFIPDVGFLLERVSENFYDQTMNEDYSDYWEKRIPQYKTPEHEALQAKFEDLMTEFLEANGFGIDYYQVTDVKGFGRESEV